MGGSQFSLGKRRHQILVLRYQTNETERETETYVSLSLCLSVCLTVCLSVFYRDEMSLMKSDNKNREREREREREFPRTEFSVEEFSVLLKRRPPPVFC